jgi:hypothetical protein
MARYSMLAAIPAANVTMVLLLPNGALTVINSAAKLSVDSLTIEERSITYKINLNEQLQ